MATLPTRMPLWTCRLNEFVCAGFAVVVQVGELASSRVPGLPSMQWETLQRGLLCVWAARCHERAPFGEPEKSFARSHAHRGEIERDKRSLRPTRTVARVCMYIVVPWCQRRSEYRSLACVASSLALAQALDREQTGDPDETMAWESASERRRRSCWALWRERREELYQRKLARYLVGSCF